MGQERGITLREGMEGREISRSAETAQTAVAEHAKANVQARFMVALNKQRNVEDARQAIIKTCKRPRFAAKARYCKPVYGAKACGKIGCPMAERGKRSRDGVQQCGHVCGLSIRAADELVKLFGNIQTEQMTIYEDEDQRIIGIACTDLETNITKAQSFTVKKTIERRKVKDGQEVLGDRLNSYGDKVYIVRATDDELMIKEAAAASKIRRNLELQMIPADILDEADEVAFETTLHEDAQDPDEAKRKVLDAFAAIGVQPSQIEAFLGHGSDGITAQELQLLRAMWSTINDGSSKWSDYMDTDEEGQAQQSEVAKDLMAKIGSRRTKANDTEQESQTQEQDQNQQPEQDDAYQELFDFCGKYQEQIDEALASVKMPPMGDIIRQDLTAADKNKLKRALKKFKEDNNI